MTQKRIIWMTFFLTMGLFFGGLYYATSVETLPCKLTARNGNLLEQPQVLFNHRFLASKIKHYAQEEGLDLCECDRAEVLYADKTIWIDIYSAADRDKIFLSLWINEKGGLEFAYNHKKYEDLLRERTAELTALQEHLQKDLQTLEDQKWQPVDFLVQPLVW